MFSCKNMKRLAKIMRRRVPIAIFKVATRAVCPYIAPRPAGRGQLQGPRLMDAQSTWE